MGGWVGRCEDQHCPINVILCLGLQAKLLTTRLGRWRGNSLLSSPSHQEFPSLLVAARGSFLVFLADEFSLGGFLHRDYANACEVSRLPAKGSAEITGTGV